MIIIVIIIIIYNNATILHLGSSPLGYACDSRFCPSCLATLSASRPRSTLIQMDFKCYFPTDCHFSAVCFEGSSLSQ